MRRLILCVVLVMNVFVCSAQDAHIALVASYEQEHVCGWPQECGVIAALVDAGFAESKNIRISRFYMDSKRVNTTREQQQLVASGILESISRSDVKIVVTLDDNAFREVGLKLAGNPDVSVVFSGLNGQPENYNKLVPCINSRSLPGYNVTGVYEKLYIVKSLQVMGNSVPGLRGGKVVAITDYSPTGLAISRQFEIELAQSELNVELELRKVKDWQEYTAEILKINDDPTVKAIYPVALSLNVSPDETYTAKKIFEWTVKHSAKPEMALNYYFSKIGLFGGAAVDFRAMGYAAGAKVADIIYGKDAGSIPVDDAPEYAIVFNYSRAHKLGITIPVALLTAADKVYK